MHAVLTEINRSGYRDYSKALKLNKAMHTNTEMKKPNELRALSCSEVRILKISIKSGGLRNRRVKIESTRSITFKHLLVNMKQTGFRLNLFFQVARWLKSFA